MEEGRGKGSGSVGDSRANRSAAHAAITTSAVINKKDLRWQAIKIPPYDSRQGGPALTAAASVEVNIIEGSEGGRYTGRQHSGRSSHDLHLGKCAPLRREGPRHLGAGEGPGMTMMRIGEGKEAREPRCQQQGSPLSRPPSTSTVLKTRKLCACSLSPPPPPPH